MKKLIFALLGTTFLTVACTSSPNSTDSTPAVAREAVSSVQDVQEQSQSSPTPEVLDWDGRWSGVIPCASCPGIEVDLTLNNDGTFRMREEYQDRGGSHFVTEGTMTWDEATRVLTLKSEDRKQQLLFEGEGEAIYLDAEGNPLPIYRLNKQAEYRAPGQQLILPLQGIRVEDNKVLFTGLLNFKEAQEGGFKSVRGDTIIDCDTRHVTFRDATYYPEVDAVGERIASITHMVQGGFRLSGSSADSVLLQVAETFCPNR